MGTFLACHTHGMIGPANTLSVSSQVSKEQGWNCGHAEAAGPSGSIQDYEKYISQRFLFLTVKFINTLPSAFNQENGPEAGELI